MVKICLSASPAVDAGWEGMSFVSRGSDQFVSSITPRLVRPQRYRYRLAGTQRPLPPDLTTDPRGTDDWITTTAGSPFFGRSIAWHALTVKDQGVDLECEWNEAWFIDRILLDASVLHCVDRVRVLIPVGGRLRQIGQADLDTRRSDEFILEQDSVVGLDVGHVLNRCVIRFETRLSDLVLPGGLTIVGTSTPGQGLFPVPARATITGPGPDVNAFASATIRPFGESAAIIAEHLRTRAEEILGWDIPVAPTRALPADFSWTGLEAIEVNLTGGDPADLASSLETPPGPEGFAMEVTNDRVVVLGDRRGLRHGVESVLQQLIMQGRLAAGTLVDEPAHGFRGVHLPIPSPAQVDYFRRLIRALIVPARFNTVILEIAGGMEFLRHPEINEAWEQLYAEAVAGKRTMPGHFNMVAPGSCLPQATLAQLVDELRALDLDVIPEVQSLSHVQYLTVAHPDIAEVAAKETTEAQVDLFLADQPAPTYPSCYCPSNPASYALIEDVLTEILDVVRPTRFVHLGHDEIYDLGVCPRCVSADPAQLFADDVNRLCGLVAERGLRPIIWSDMLQPEAPYRAAAALDQLPHDLVMMDFIWYFHRESDTETTLLDQGLDVVIGNLYSSHFPRWERRSSRPGILGGQVSTWIALDDEAMAREGKYFDICMVGIMLWSQNYHRHHRLSDTDRIAKFLPDLRDRLTQTTTVPSGHSSTVDLLAVSQPGPSIGSAPSDPLLSALLSRVDGPISFPGRGHNAYEITAPVALPRTDHDGSPAMTLRIDLPAGLREIHLIHALSRAVPRIPWQPLAEIGRYRFIDDHGVEIGVLPLTSGGTVDQIHRRWAAPLPTSYYRHQGYTATYRADAATLGQLDNGRDLCLYRSIWVVPDSGNGAAAINVEVDAEIGTALLLCAAIGAR